LSFSPCNFVVIDSEYSIVMVPTLSSSVGTEKASFHLELASSFLIELAVGHFLHIV
jgi:hypothetical protein